MNGYIAAGVLAAFALWTVLVCFVDVRAIGPRGTEVGFAVLNGFVHELIGVHMTLYAVTDWMGLVPVGIAMGFAVLGLAQWIKRKYIRKVDRSILALGGFYAAVMAAYAFFEAVVINYRPVLIGGALEVSYPSSTTVLVLCVMPTAAMQLNGRIKNGTLRRCAVYLIAAFTGFMLIGRLISGVHWVTDIIGGVLLSAGLVLLYCFAAGSEMKK
ncbi:MAG: phosphatase PAP2 family protein [Clostridia bacterium]|nr:phosphatase PAP2 family protein [Clostridia bacterium]